MTMNTINARIRLGGAVLLACTLLAQATWAQGGPIRIVVLPFYTEAGADVTDGGYEGRHYRRLSRYINNQFVRRGFEVINPSAHEYTEAEYNRLRERAREDSPLAAMELTRKFLVDAVYLVWLDVNTRVTDGGLCKAKARVEGEGYDSGGSDLGAGLDRAFSVTRNECDDAIVGAEKLAGDEVGRLLTAWSVRRKASRATTSVVSTAGTGTRSDQGGMIERTTDALGSLINVRLEEATRYELVEVFGKVLNTARGAVEARTFRTVIQPGNPQASFVAWRVRIENTDPFRFQANVMTMLRNIADAGGEIVLKGVPYRYTLAEVDLLKGIRPGNSTSRSIVFVVDRDRAQAIELSGGDDTGNPPEPVVAASEIAKGLTTVVSSDAHYQDKAYIDIPIYFDYDSDQVSDRSRAQVGEIARALRTWSLRRARIRIEGHTDERGSIEYNLDLSKRRAASVKRMLVGKYGIAGERLETVGFGESRPVDPGHDEAAWAANRRVTFVNLGS